MPGILAIDAGGTATRAVLLDTDGNCWGFGRAGGGNPISAGFDLALESLAQATSTALRTSEPAAESFSSALVALAGATSRMPTDALSRRFASLGLRGELTLESDLLAMFRTGTLSAHGYALVAGTGSVAARFEDGRLHTVSGGAGWLVGDGGSGYWIGHEVARAVVASLDGRGPETALTALLLAELNLGGADPAARRERSHGRSPVLLGLIDRLYSRPPVTLSRFAPLAFHAQHDPVASGILARAAAELVDTITAVRPKNAAGPVVLGGSILGGMPSRTENPVARAVAETLTGAELIQARNGVVGAAVLALAAAGIVVDTELHARIGRSIARMEQAAEAAT